MGYVMNRYIYPGEYPRSWGAFFKGILWFVFVGTPVSCILCFALFGGWVVFTPWALTSLFGLAPLMYPLGWLLGAGLTIFSWVFVMSS